MRRSLFITSGHGPAECNQAVAHVLARMQQEAEAQSLAFDSDVTPAKHGAKSAIVSVDGAAAKAFAQSWLGTIQWRAESKLRRNHKRANWFIGVFAITPDQAAEIKLAPQDVTFESFRAGGPGGQHQNTTDSAVRATHRPTGVTVVAREERSQHRNKSLALTRLQALLAARATAEAEDRKSARNALHHQLERGNPVRRFTGPAFTPQKGPHHE